MRPDTSSSARLTVLLAVLTGAVVVLLTWLAVPSPTAPAGWTHTAAGPVGTADRAMLVAVRQAALWEMPVGQQAQQMASDPEVRRVTAHMSDELRVLSENVRAVADRLGVPLPSQPTAGQQAWAAEIAGESGSGYDRTMLSHLRATCVATLAAIDEARAATGSPEVRSLADEAASVVGGHLRLLDAATASSAS